MSDLNLCLSCGLCCDGSLIGFVQLDNDEIPRIKEIMEIEDENGHGLFIQPCSKFCDGCTIYEQRPKNCDKYNCELLLSVQQDEIPFDSALEIIQDVKQRKLEIQKMLGDLNHDLQSNSFYFKMVELKNILKKKSLKPGLTATEIELSTNIHNLDQLITKRFGVSLT